MRQKILLTVILTFCYGLIHATYYIEVSSVGSLTGGSNYGLNATASPLQFVINKCANGSSQPQVSTSYTLTWYYNTVNSTTGGTIVNQQGRLTNANLFSETMSFTPPTNVAGTRYYYAIISNPGSTGCGFTGTLVTNTQAVTIAAPATHLNFDGLSDYVLLNPTAINNLAQGTIEAWVYLNNLNQQTICAKQSDFENSYAVFTVGGGRGIPISGKVTYQSTNSAEIRSNSSITINQWTHIAVVFNGSQAQIYINGILDNSVFGNFSLPPDTTVTATSIGGWLGDGGGQFLNGNIEEFRVWNVARSANQIVASKNCELQGNETGLVTYYKFNQGFNAISNAGLTTLNNTVSGGTSGTLTGFALNGATSNWLAGSPVTTGVMIPNAPVASAQTFCSGSNPKVANLSATGSGGTIKWYNVAAGGTALVATTALTTGSYYVSETNANGCESNRTTVSVTVSINPNVPTATTTINYIKNATATALTATSGGTGLLWYTVATGGTGSTTAPIPSTTTTGSTSYWVSSTNTNGCESARVEIVVTVNNQITLQYHGAGAGGAEESSTFNITLNNLTTCQNSASLEVNGYGYDPIFYPVKYKVIVNGITIANMQYGINTYNLTPYMPINTVVISGDGNISAWIVLDVLLNIQTQTTLPTTGPTVSNLTYCLNDTASPLTATLTNGNTTLKWFTSAIGDNYSATAPTPTTTTAGTISYWVAQASASGCETERSKIDLTVNASPSAPLANAQTFCSADNPTVANLTTTGSGGTIKWYNVAAGGTALVATTALTTGSYYVSETNANGCESARTTVIVTVNTTPNAPVASAQTFCSGSNPTVANLSATGNGGTIKWYNLATGGTALVATTALTTGNYYVSETNSNGCESNRTTVNVMVSPSPTTPTTTTIINYVSNATATALTATSGGTGLLWYTVATGGTGSITAPIPSTTTTGSTSYWVSSTNTNGCESARVQITVNVALPATHLNFDGVNDYVSVGNIIPNASSYTKEAWVYMTSNTLGRNILSSLKNPFFVDHGNLSAGNNGIYLVVQDPTTIPLNTWVHVAVTYDAASATMKLYKNGILVATNTNAPTFVAENSFIGSHNGSQYFFGGNIDDVRIWNVARTADQIAASRNCELQGNETGLVTYYKFNQGLNAISNAGLTTLNNTVSGGTSGTLTGFALNGATSNWLAGSPVTTGVMIPNAPVASAQTFCSGSNPKVANLSATGSGGTIKWYNVATGGTALVATTALTTGSYYVSETNANGCESARTTIIVTVNTTPNSPVASAQTFCSGSNPTVANLSATGNGGTIKWYNVAAGGTALVVTTALTTGSYYVSETNANGCESARTTVIVTVNTTPNAPVANAQTFCSANNPTVANLTATGSGGTIKWYDVATGGTALTSTTVLTTENYYVSETNANGCESARTTVSVTVNTTPNAPVASAQTFCSADNPTVANLTTTGSGGTIKWYNVATGGTALIATTTLTTGNYYVSETNANGCESGRTSVSVAVINCLSSQVRPDLCGLTKSMEDWLYVTNAVAPTGSTVSYIIEATNLTTNAVATITKPNVYFKFSELSNVDYGSPMSIRVKVVLNGSPMPSFGTACTVTVASTTVNTQIGSTTCGTRLGELHFVIPVVPICKATSYTVEVSRLDSSNAVVETVTYTTPTSYNAFALTDITGLTVAYDTSYSIRVKANTVNGTSNYGSSCVITTRRHPSLAITSGCNTQMANIGVRVYSSSVVSYGLSYRFYLSTTPLTLPSAGTYVTNLTGSAIVINTHLNLFTFSQATGYVPNTAYYVLPVIVCHGKEILYGTSCTITSPATGGTSTAIASETNPTVITKQVAPEFNVVAYPNPFDSSYKLNMTTVSEEVVSVIVYDMLGKQVEDKNISVSDLEGYELGNSLPSGVYNVIVSQGTETKTIRVIKK